MKNLKRLSFLMLLITFMTSCGNMKDKNTETSKTISGTVKSIERGKDGYTAKVEVVDHEVYNFYFATISIVNVGGPQNYKQLKEGDKVTLKGEFWKTDTELHIKVKEIVSVK
jgi:hypothetical protein